MEHHSVNSVQVFSTDEEKLKFRVIIAIDGSVYRLANAGGGRVMDGDGSYEIDIPVPTSIANSEKYNQCLIKCDTFSATAGPAVGAPTWARSSGVAVTASAFELNIGVGCGQTTSSTINTAVGAVPVPAGNAGDRNQPVIGMSGYRQLIPGQIVNVGNGLGFAAGAAGYGWLGMMRDLTPLLCANPFGQRIRLSILDPLSREKSCIMNSAALGGGDLGRYYIQLDVTMIPNKQGC